MYRLKLGSTTPERDASLPSHPYTLYLTGGVAVLAQTWNQRDTPDLASVVSVSTDGKATFPSSSSAPAAGTSSRCPPSSYC